VDTTIDDEPDVKEICQWLSKYPKVRDQYIKAKADFDAPENFRNMMDNLRLALELLVKEVVSNTKSLENNVNAIGQILKERGYNPEFTNMFRTMLDYYTKYQNNHVKHDDSHHPGENRFIFMLTTEFMRCLAS
jgi:hypothetical protein